MDEDNIIDKNIDELTDPELDHGDIEDLDEFVGDSLEGVRTGSIMDTGFSDRPGDMGATGDIGLEELATEERLQEENYDRDQLRVPSDMRSPGDPNAGDVGISGGISTGDLDVMETEDHSEDEEIDPEFS